MSSRSSPGLYHPRRHAGVTLVELVVALMLGGMVLLGLGYVYALNQGLWLRSQAKMTLHAAATRALEEIGRSAGHAADFAVIGDQELRLVFSPSPLGEPGPVEMVFRLREQRLLRDDEALVPSPGDSALGVSGFQPRITFAEGTGMRMLSVRLSLFTRDLRGAPMDTLHVETEVHARNEGLGLEATAGEAPSRPPEGPYF